MLRARLLALFLDVLVCSVPADLGGLVLTALVWRFAPQARSAVPGIWLAAGALATGAFLLRDARGGRARRWLGLEARRPDGGFPGVWGSILRNLPLLLPLWNLWDAWPLTRDGEGQRRCDRPTGTRILRIT